MSEELRKIAFSALHTTVSEMQGTSEHFCETFDIEEVMFALYPEEEWVKIFKIAKDQLQEEIDKDKEWLSGFSVRGYENLADHTLDGISVDFNCDYYRKNLSEDLINASEEYRKLRKSTR